MMLAASAMGDMRIESILNDSRFDRLFRGEANCALQLWVLQRKQDEEIESRLLYGRLLPYSMSKGTWSAPREDRYAPDTGTQVVRISAYLRASEADTAVRMLAAGDSIGAVRVAVGHGCSERFGRFDHIQLFAEPVFRPAMMMPMRDYNPSGGPASPHQSAAAFSASVTSIDKVGLFDFPNANPAKIATSAVSHLNDEIGSRFADADAWRLGDLEILAFPALDALEQHLVSVEVGAEGVEINFLGDQWPADTEVRVRIKLLNDESLVHDQSVELGALGTARQRVIPLAPEDGRFGMADAFELDILAKRPGATSFEWFTTEGAYLVRSVNGSVGFPQGTHLVESDWLDKGVAPASKKRLAGVREIQRERMAGGFAVGDRKADPWVPLNRALTARIKHLVPPRSDGRFFHRLHETGGTGRLALAEWLQGFLSEHQGQQIAWFDPYMEDAGIVLLAQHAPAGANCIVFTTARRKKLEIGFASRMREKLCSLLCDSVPTTQQDDRTHNLVAACTRLAPILAGTHLRVVAMDPEKLHDRMILVRTNGMEPVVGYHLSNSIQRATENYPLLITPIPADTLKAVFEYMDALLLKTHAAGDGALRFLFDSQTAPTSRPERKHVYEIEGADAVLAWWLDTPDLAGCTQHELRARLEAIGVLEGGSLRGKQFEEVPEKFWSEPAGWGDDFAARWRALGEVLAWSHSGDSLRSAGAALSAALSARSLS